MNRKALSLLPFAFFFALVGCNVNVQPNQKDDTTKSMLLMSPPDKTEYNVGQAFDLTGLSVIEPKTREEIKGYVTSIEEGYVFKASDTRLKSVTISKSGYNNVSFDIKVTNYKLMKIDTLPNKISYDIGEAFSSSGLIVKDVDTDAVITNVGLSIQEGTILDKATYEGTTSVRISKSGYSPISYDITVSEYPQLSVAKKPDIIYYVIGDIFSLQGLQITCNGAPVTDYTVTSDLVEGEPVDAQGSYNIVISKEGYRPVSFKVSVYNEASLVVSSLPTRTGYATGEAFDSTGLVIRDKNNEIVDDYTLSIKDGEIFKTKGTHKIIVSKKGFRDVSFDISVSQGSGSLSQTQRLNVYYMNDTHGSYYPMSEYSEAGIIKVAPYLEQQKMNDIYNGYYSLTLSGGDMFQGGLESNETRGKIMIDAMNKMGFEAMALGNHELDWGEEYPYQFADRLDCPILSCNFFYASNHSLRPSYVTPYTVIEKGNLKIGIVGGAETGMNSSMTGSVGSLFYIPNAMSFIKQSSDELRLSYNCDIVIGVFHDGGYDASKDETAPEAYYSVTQTNVETGRKYLDAMFFAHDHYQKKGVYEGVPYMESGSNGKYLGCMTLDLNTNGNIYEVGSYSTYNTWTYTACTTEDTELKDLITTTYKDEIGEPTEVICHFSTNYSRNEFVALACEAMLWYVNERYPSVFGNTHVYFSSHNYQGARATIYEGDMTRRNWVKSFPFDNNLCIQTCTQANITNMINSTYYVTKSESTIPYDSSGHTKAVSITYITEYKYAYNYQVSYVKYQPTAKDAFELWLREGIKPV